MTPIIPATNETAGPFRKVIGTHEQISTYRGGLIGIIERLECGHNGKHLGFPGKGAMGYERFVAPIGKRRRCYSCLIGTGSHPMDQTTFINRDWP